MTLTPAVSAKKARERIEAIADILKQRDEALFTGDAYEADDDEREDTAEVILAALSTEGEAEPVAWPLPADKELPPITDRGFAGQIMDVAWPHYGGNHQTAEFWNNFGEGVRFALHYASPPSAPASGEVVRGAIVTALRRFGGVAVLARKPNALRFIADVAAREVEALSSAPAQEGRS